MNDSYFLIIYLLGSILLLVLITLGIKLIITIDKINKVIDDLTEKSKKLDGIFNAIDRFTDMFSSVNDKLISLTVGKISNLFNKIKSRKERNDTNE